MKENSAIFVGLDVSKLKISVALAEGERSGEVRFLGDISSEPASVAALSASSPSPHVHFTFVTRRVLQVTVSTARLWNWDMNAL